MAFIEPIHRNKLNITYLLLQTLVFVSFTLSAYVDRSPTIGFFKYVTISHKTDNIGERRTCYIQTVELV